MPAHPPDSPARFHAVLPCAGIGTRAGTDGPKQYQPLAGRPLVLHTLDALAQVGRIDSLLVVVAAGDERMPPGPSYSIVARGGATRAETVANGLDELHRRGAAATDWVLVHDAARCLVTPALVDRLIDACAGDEVGGLLAQPVADTLKAEAHGRVTATLPRQHTWLAQTPQMFRLGLLRRALAQAGAAVTDEASAIEALGLQPRLVPGSAHNFKVTWPEDFALAEAVLANRVPGHRTP